MQKLHFSIEIDATKEKVWHTMLDQDTYQQWTKAFDGNSRYVGNWEKGSEIKFIGGEEGSNEEMGMYSRIRENRLYEYVSIEHLGLIKNGQVDTTSEEVKKWTPAYENYTFTEQNGKTKVEVDLNIADEYKEMFEEMWPKALQLLKELAES